QDRGAGKGREEAAHHVSPNLFDIARMNPWTGTKLIIALGSGEPPVGRRRFAGTRAAFTAQSDA
ncbi:MAG: hypothetical protein Q8M69_04260, partial [Reyranella sp.]|nr:hypothetical protein [Reyranella sp.]